MVEILDDNVHVTCIIGNGETGEGEFNRRQRLVEDDDADVHEWEIIEAEVVLTDSSKANYVEMVITPGEDTPYPDGAHLREKDGGLLGKEFTLDVETELRPNTPGPKITRLFTGNIANMTPTGKYTFEAVAYDKTQQPFLAEDSTGGRDTQNAYVTISQPTSLEEVSDGPNNTPILISRVVEKVCDTLNIPEDDREINLRFGGTKVGETPSGRPVFEGRNGLIRFESWQVTAEKALTRAEESANATWWFDRYGTFHFGPRLPDENIRAYELTYITDSSAGMTTPPYRSVKVIGDGVASEGGWEKSSLISESKYTASGNVYTDAEEAELAEPTFIHRNMQISTAREANEVRDKLIKKLQNQAANGDVTVVGFPELYPNDAIEMPQTEQQPMGGARYGITKVIHRLNNEDGFITKVEVSGIDDAQRTLYNDEEDVLGLQEELEESLGESRSPRSRLGLI